MRKNYVSSIKFGLLSLTAFFVVSALTVMVSANLSSVLTQYSADSDTTADLQSNKAKVNKTVTSPAPMRMAVARQNVGGSLRREDAPLPTKEEVDDYFSVRGKQFRDVKDSKTKKILDAHHAMNFIKFRKMLLEKKVPFEPNLLLRENWKEVLKKNFPNFIDSLKSIRLTENKIGGVIMADTLYLPERIELTADTLILANKIVYEGNDIVLITRGHNLWHSTIRNKIILTKPIEGKSREYTLTADNPNFEEEFFEKNFVADPKLSAFSVVGAGNRKFKAFEKKREDGERLIEPLSIGTKLLEGTGVSGTGGSPGRDGRDAACPSLEGESGGDGRNGTDGGMGDDGPSITIEPGESPTYADARGYDGGNGGYGGRGGNGGNGVQCTDSNGNVSVGNGGNGGDSGDGGDGGDGGNGGSILIRHYPDVMIPGSTGTEIQGGRGGIGGVPEAGGIGGRSGGCSGGTCGTSGTNGRTFSTGFNGRNGFYGIVDTEVVPRPNGGGGGCFSSLSSYCGGGSCTNWYWVYYISWDGGLTWQVTEVEWAGCW
jgi:hypothetical protein